MVFIGRPGSLSPYFAFGAGLDVAVGAGVVTAVGNTGSGNLANMASCLACRVADRASPRYATLVLMMAHTPQTIAARTADRAMIRILVSKGLVMVLPLFADEGPVRVVAARVHPLELPGAAGVDEVEMGSAAAAVGAAVRCVRFRSFGNPLRPRGRAE